MAMRTRINRSALLILLSIVAVFATAGFLVPSETSSGETSPLPILLWGMGGLVLTVVLSLLIWAGLVNRKRAIAEWTWMDGNAEVLEVTQLGTVNKQPWVEISLMIENPAGETYTAKLKQVIPATALHLIEPGNVLSIRINPDDPQEIMPV
jgi:hypothetical protein